MEIYRKNNAVESELQAQELLNEQDVFYSNLTIGAVPPILDSELLRIWNGGEHLEWEWSEESQHEYSQRIAQEEAEAAELAFFQDPANLEAWKNAKVRPWRNQKLAAWVDDTFIRPLMHGLSPEQETERINIRQELLDWPHDFDEWVNDAAIDELKPAAPSWVSV